MNNVEELILKVLEYKSDSDVDEMNKEIIENWNSVVTDSDIVFHLEDVALTNIINILLRQIILTASRIGSHLKLFK